MPGALSPDAASPTGGAAAPGGRDAASPPIAVDLAKPPVASGSDALFVVPGRDAAAAKVLDAGAPGASAPVKAQCQKDSDCVLVNDCCSCQALGKDEKAPSCDPKIACVQTRCMEYGAIERGRCITGRCVLALDCDTSTVACRRAAPTCAPGQVPRVIGTGATRCYGECTDARQCAAVPGCASCGKDDLCVKTFEAGRWHCVPPVPACGTAQSCACAGPAICTPPTARCEQPSAMSRELACSG